MKPLMKSARFAPLFWTQFLSAFNDNFLKNALVFMILFSVADGGATLISAAGAVFIAPFLFLSALGGQIADHCDKAAVARKLKFAEIGGAGLTAAGMVLSSVPVMFAALFIFGAVSALFSPVKYGILPDHLQKSELPKANAWVEAGTFMAILGGTISAGILYASGNSSVLFAPIMISLAISCYLVSLRIPSTQAAAPDLKPDWNIVRSTTGILRDLFADNRLARTALMTSWFWLIGALVMSVLPVIVKETLGGGELAVTWFLAVFAVSIGIGSALAAWLSAGRVVLLPSAIGTALLAVFAADAAYTIADLSPNLFAGSFTDFISRAEVIRLSVDMAGLAIAGALLVVPTFAALQAWAVPERRARTIAGANALGAGLMTVGGVALAYAQKLGVTPATVMTVIAGMNAAAAVLMFKCLPTDPFRDILSIIYRAFFRMEVRGLENLDDAGEAPILALNHVSYLDAGLALTLTDKAPTFAIDYGVARRWWVKPFLKLANALPINPAKPMATRSLINAVNSGQPMVIFPEGRLTVTGGLMKVYDGAAMVADKTGAKVVPIRIDGLERTPFSYLSPSQIRKALFPKVRVTILKPQELKVDEELKGRRRRAAAGAKLYDLMSDLMFQTDLAKGKTIIERVIDTAKDRGLSKVAIEDPVTGSLTYGKLLTGISVLGRKIANIAGENETIGIMLPNANGAAVTTLATMSAGKVPAMINFTAGTKNVLSACKTAQVQKVLSSRAFVDQAKLTQLVEEVAKHVEFVWLEDVREQLGFAYKLTGMLKRGRPIARRNIDDPAAILFTSGSEGTPKGVVLSHANILANATQAEARIDFSSNDKVFNVLPMFHSFGLTAGTILPLASGVPIYMYPSPLHYRIVPELIYASNATILFGTDTFLNGYARVAHAYDFRSLRYCFAGAEPVKAATRQVYMERFGVRVLEGYGVTETAPVIAINTPMFNKAGTVGKLMPGMSARLETVPGIGHGGRLYVTGPNVMLGYLKSDKPGVLQPLTDGWHDTGDIVDIDEEGFISISGRAKRFAKIGGEMISLAAVEEIAAKLWPSVLSAVAAVKDDRKGEKLILFSEEGSAARTDFLKYAKAHGIQDLMVPAEVRVVNKVPVLGSGKIDFVSVMKLAEERPQVLAA
ncbi:acyl-[ACP]--phospholipid O-acyltransferase [Roseibium alexandrii]|uniref:Bifunctional protein aas n=1 Tax=Roseibium alexandrii TaxID=388408 RepID=A0A0M7ASD9_9HYPH|nr:acyl-[ACP]--phospholipid O-acyltransferase [Roseibium alexandrii]CTQ76484.1 Bifunctional protein aas [Roseibium alexandrii]